jgi:hypothetical protein
MRKFMMFVLVFLLVGCAGAIGAIYYIRPDPALSLDYAPVSFRAKALDMARSLTLEIELTEDEVNDLLKQVLARNPYIHPDLEVQGARFELEGHRLAADLRLLWKERIPAGVRVVYQLSWEAPYLKAVSESVHVKEVALPANIAPDLLVPIGEELPALLRIQAVEFNDHSLKIRLRQPALGELIPGAAG